MRYNIFVDLDGVMVDWLGAAAKLMGLELTSGVQLRIAADPCFFDTLVPRKELIARVDAAGPEFWANLESFPWAENLISTLLRLPGDITFLTSPIDFARSAEGKRIWATSRYPDFPIVLAQEKYILAQPRSFLIDDNAHQVRRFRQHGGSAWQWTHQNLLVSGGERVWNAEITWMAAAIRDAIKTVGLG